MTLAAHPALTFSVGALVCGHRDIQLTALKDAYNAPHEGLQDPIAGGAT